MQNGTIFDPSQKNYHKTDRYGSYETIDNKIWYKYMVDVGNSNGVVNSYISELAFNFLFPIFFFQYLIICTKLFIDWLCETTDNKFCEHYQVLKKTFGQ